MRIPLAGDIIFGRFEMLANAGSGGQSLGYRARDLFAPDDQPWLHTVFLKQFHDLVPGTPEALGLDRHFLSLREKLSDKANYVCLPLYHGVAENSVIAAYPWIQGSTLRERIAAGLTRLEAVRLAMALTKTVRIIHKAGVIHLDLKPANVVVKHRPKDNLLYLQLIDLDAARIDGAGLRDHALYTAGYSSPEHFVTNFGDLSEKSDVFTLGIVVYELLTGRSPFEEATDYVQAILNEDFDVSDGALHADVRSIIARCLHPHPSKRPFAGTIQNVLTKHYTTLFEAGPDVTAEVGRLPRRSYVQIECESGGPEFRRVYFDSKAIDRNELRGAGAQCPPGPLLTLLSGPPWYLIPLSSVADIKVDEALIATNVRVKLRPVQVVSLGGRQFLLRLVPY